MGTLGLNQKYLLKGPTTLGGLIFLCIALAPLIKNILGAILLLLLVCTSILLLSSRFNRHKTHHKMLEDKAYQNISLTPLLCFSGACLMYFLSCLAAFFAKPPALRTLSDLDLPLRFILVPIIGVLTLAYVRRRGIDQRWFSWSFPVAAAATLSIAIYQKYGLGYSIIHGVTNHYILFSFLSAMIGAACLGVSAKPTWISITGFLLASSAAFLSASRGSWPGICLILILHPLFIAYLFNNDRTTKIKLVAVPLIAVSLIIMLALIPSTNIIFRLTEAKTDLERYFNEGDPISSLGFRLEMFKGAWIIFKSNWTFGVGIGEFNNAFQQLIQIGAVADLKTTDIHHAHNDLLQALATMGLFGAIGYVLILVVPGIYFLSELLRCKHQLTADLKMNQIKRLTQHAGFNLVGLYSILVFAVAGLSEALLTRNLSVNYYLFIICFTYVFVSQSKAGA